MPEMTTEQLIPEVSPEALVLATPDEIDAHRRAAPLVRTHPMRVAALRAAGVLPLSTDPRLLQLPGGPFCDAMGIPAGRVRSFIEGFMLMTNGPQHAHLRGAFNRTFSHPAMREKRTQVRTVADRIVADLPRGEPFDFLALCASRLPAEVIAEVLGLPVDSSSWFAGQVYSLSRTLMIPYDIEHHAEIEAAAVTLYAFVAEALESRRAAPQDDLLSELATDESARALDPEALVHQVMGVILAGSDTTRSGFNMVVARLLAEPELWNEVAADRSLIPAAVSEGLRIEPPVGSLPRYVPTALEVGGCPVAAGQILGLSTMSAMRDEEAYTDPDRFDLHREDHPRYHPVFGGGAHRCLGEMLARIEMEEGLAALMDGAAGITLVEAPRMTGFAGIRRATPMTVRIG